MGHTAMVTPQRKRVSARYAQNIATKRGAHQQAETTRLKRLPTRRLSANMRKSRTSRLRRPLSLRRSPFVSYSRSCYTTTTTSHRQQTERHRRELKHPYQKKKRHHHQRLEHRHQGLEHYRKKLGCPRQELHLIFRPGTHILQQLGPHRMYRITRPPVQDPIQESRIPSTTRTRQEHR